MVTKVKIKGVDFSKVSGRVKLQIGRAIKKSNAEEEVTEVLVEEIRKNGIKPDLKISTINKRKQDARHNITHSSYRAGKSNLTFSGQLLDSLRSIFIVSKLLFTI